MDYLTTHASLSPIRCGFASGFVNYKKAALESQPASDKVYQLLAHGRWFSPGTPASSITKTGRRDIAVILLKVALNTKINQSFVISPLSDICNLNRLSLSCLGSLFFWGFFLFQGTFKNILAFQSFNIENI